MRWTDEEDAVIRKLAPEGATCREIAESLPGRNKLAVLGRAHRIGVKLKGQSSDRLRDRAANARPKQPKKVFKIGGTDHKPPTPPTPPKPAWQSNPTPFLLATSRQCQYPLWGEERIPIEEKLVCGADGYPWCEKHRAQLGIDRLKTSAAA